MKPPWFICDRCLFFEADNISENAQGNCNRSPHVQRKRRDDYCASWTCRRCLESWCRVNWEYFDRERTMGWEYHGIINHAKCQEV